MANGILSTLKSFWSFATVFIGFANLLLSAMLCVWVRVPIADTLLLISNDPHDINVKSTNTPFCPCLCVCARVSNKLLCGKNKLQFFDGFYRVYQRREVQQ